VYYLMAILREYEQTFGENCFLGLDRAAFLVYNTPISPQSGEDIPWSRLHHVTEAAAHWLRSGSGFRLRQS